MNTTKTNGHTTQNTNKTTGPQEDSKTEKVGDYRVQLIQIPVAIRGITPLIVNNFNKKTRDQMLDKHKGLAAKARAPKDVGALYEGSKYLDDKGRECFPAATIKHAMVAAARNVKVSTMTALKQTIFILGPEGPMQRVLPIEYKRVYAREDMTRNSNGQPDVRIRACYEEWTLRFTIQALRDVISTTQLLQLLNAAGFSVGIGEWRPAAKVGNGGDFGRFEIAAVGDDALVGAVDVKKTSRKSRKPGDN